MSDKQTILLVEDDRLIALATKLTIQGFGYQVAVAHSGEAAVDVACAPPRVDLILMDMDLGPGIDGTEAARRILARRNVPIVFLSSHSERAYVEKVRGLTRYGYVAKDSGDFVLQSSIEMAFELFAAHERLRESEGRLATLLRTIPDLVWLKDTDGVYLACNPSFERLYGVPEREIVGRTDFDFADPELASFFREKDKLAIARGGPSLNEEWLTFAADGQRGLFETIKTPMVDASGTVIGVLGIARDVTERNRAEQALKESEERVQRKLRAVVEPGGDLGALGMRDILDVSTLQALMEDVSALTGMVTAILDLEGNILIATGWQDICTQFHRACPGTAAHCTKSDLFLVKHVKQGEYVEYRCENGLWDVVTPLYVEDRHLGNIYTGQFFYDSDEVDEAFFIDLAACYGFEAAPYLDALRRVPRLTRTQVARHMDYLVRITRFISRLSIANLRLARATAELRRSEEEKALLYSELQHRVKNSLALVSSVLRLNLGDVAEDGPRGILQEAAHRVRCVSMAYDQLTQPSRVGNVRLDAYLAGLAELLHKTYAPRPEDVRLDVTLGAVECPQKQAISVGLIFNELFTNALKYGCEASRRATIAITLSCEGGTVALRIADDGRGLPAGLVPTTAKSLGLRIVHLLAAELGGDVEFAQTAGTTAQLRFPRP